ncbi:hypothetical protein HNP33_002715 [Comamonas odontotermitis]|uniref:Uncharacterized protein n=1 Tax=Comamonas odontotermitis TaxID=379895 RepID=A0ABR6RHL1_9BURK|nr:hypothetical protein [Comamonas odontotermitis]
MAASSDCYAIKDGDKRAYCLAVVKRDYGYCHHIKDGDKRNQCMAESKGTRSNCYAIKELDARGFVAQIRAAAVVGSDDE